MYLLVLSSLIVAGQPLAPIEGRYPDASEVFVCDFEENWDVNFDQWPDRWSRRRGPSYPHYIDVRIEETSTPQGLRALRVQMDGGAAVLYSPPIEIGTHHSYVLEGRLKTERLVHDEAFLSVSFLNEKRRTLDTFTTRRTRSEGAWQKLRLGPLVSEHPEARYVVIGLHIEPTAKHDLDAVVMFDDLWFAQLPRMQVTTGHPFNLFTDPSSIEITCRVTGSTVSDQVVAFELTNVFGEVLSSSVEPMREIDTTEAFPNEEEDAVPQQPTGFSGVSRWRPPITKPGFYRVSIILRGRQAPVHRRVVTLAVIQPQERPDGEFGWSLPNGENPLALEPLSELLPQVGVHWVKFPMWYGESDADRGDKLAWFIERLGGAGISLVGLLHDPPQEVRSRYGQPGDLTAAELFTSGAEVWGASLETVMLRLSMKVRWWQLGRDRDNSFVGYPALVDKIFNVRNMLEQTGYDVRVGLGWDWLYETQSENFVPWRFLTYAAEPALTSTELDHYLDTSPDAGVQRWVVLEPLPRSTYPLQVRAVDLVRRMVTAKIHGVEAIFVPQPFDAERGVMNDDGTPGELLLPWRTAALKLAGAKYVGSLRLPGGSPNHVFARDDNAVMVVWNPQPIREVVYLGDRVVQTDIWGRDAELALDENRQVLEVGPLPSFVSGVNEAVTRWRMGFSIAQKKLPSVFGKPHEVQLRFENPFPQGASGTIRLVMPDRWLTEPEEMPFKLAVGESMTRRFTVTLPFNANSGRHDIRVDFDIAADRRYQLSLHRTIEVGLGDVEMEVVSRLDASGNLEIEQRIINHTDDPVSFHCSLFAPGRRRLRAQMLDVGRGQEVQVYHLRQGSELLGQTLWLRAQEIGGQRVLSNRFVAEP